MVSSGGGIRPLAAGFFMSENTIEFTEFPKIARLSREAIITEKIDGTNASIFIGEDGTFLTGSRTRWITPASDNYGFSKWAHEHKDELMTLGPGHHFGEWWGAGIQRRYGQSEKRFSLFNTVRWCRWGERPAHINTGDPRIIKIQDTLPKCCGLVPELYRGNFSTLAVLEQLERLREYGSYAAPGFTNPEGVVIYHTAARVAFKKTLHKDEEPKSLSRL